MTALALTAQPSTASVLLEVTGAPVPAAPVYTGAFPATVDSFVAGTDTEVFWNASNGKAAAGSMVLIWARVTTTEGKAARTVTGLTIGHTYTLAAWVLADTHSKSRVGVTGIGSGIWVTGIGEGPGQWQKVTYTFTATATSHEILAITSSHNPAGTESYSFFDDVTVTRVVGTGPTTITRVDVNGARPVRLLDGQEPIAGVLTVTDYEPALTGSIRYDVTDTDGVTTSQTIAAPVVSNPWLHVPVLPSVRVELDLVTDYNAERPNGTTVHEVIGREDPLPVMGPSRTRRGRARVWAPDYATARAAEDVLRQGEVVMLRQPTYPGLDMYLVPESLQVVPIGATVEGQRWALEFGYLEVAAPTGPLLGGTGWSFADVAKFATFADVRATYDTFADLTANTP